MYFLRILASDLSTYFTGQVFVRGAIFTKFYQELFLPNAPEKLISF